MVTITRPAFEGMIAAEPRLALNLLWIISGRLRRMGALRVEDRRFRLDVQLLQAIWDGSARHRRRT